MKIKVKYNAWWLLGNFSAITLYPYIFVKGDTIDDVTLKHELIHVGQIKHHGIFKFYASYVLSFIVKSLSYRSFSEGYYNIHFEKVAYERQRDAITEEERSWLA